MIGKTISHYKILEKLGQGGMGVVYKAMDTKLKRTVALKFLSPAFSFDKEAKKRFRHEAQTASSLQHHNICNIHDIDETENGQVFICMDFYEGNTLKEKIESEQKINYEAIDIIIQLATGLQKAHEKGIIHRDIKPANIFITNDGVVKILDFGVAKLSGQTMMTKIGETLGTIAYMSPEQAKGEEVDHRTDIWSVGVVMYEVLTGTLPFNADYDQAVIYSILNENPKPINLLQKDAAPRLAKIINKTLEKDASKRYQNILELLEDLKSSNSPEADILKQEKSIIVLPFDDLSPGHDQEYFSDGLTEEIISDLSGIKSLRVISRSSAMTFKGTKKKIPEIAREVNVQYVLEGSVRKAGDSLRITAQLIEAQNDNHIWAEKYSGSLEDVFGIQEKVSLSIVDKLRLKILPNDVDSIKNKAIKDVNTFDYYLRARDQINNFNIKALKRAIDFLKKAESETGGNASIYSLLAYAYAQYVNLGHEHEEYIEKAESFANMALQKDPNSSEALTVLGFIELFLSGNVKKSLKYLETSYLIRPNDTNTLMWLSVIYAQIGRIEEARKAAIRASEVDPLTTIWYGVIGTIELYAGCFDKALQLMEKALSGGKENPGLQAFYTVALFYKQKNEQIKSFVSENANSEERTTMDYIMIMLSYAVDRRSRDLHDLFKKPETMKTFRRDSQSSWFAASAFACAGDFNAALDWLENSVNRGFLNYETILKFDPFLSKLSSEPRFEKLIQFMKTERKKFDG